MEEMHGSKSSDCIKNEGMLLIKSTLSQEKHYVTVPSGQHTKSIQTIFWHFFVFLHSIDTAKILLLFFFKGSNGPWKLIYGESSVNLMGE